MIKFSKFVNESDWQWKRPKTPGAKKKWIKKGGEIFNDSKKEVQTALLKMHSDMTRKDTMVDELESKFDAYDVNAIVNYIDEVNVYMDNI